MVFPACVVWRGSLHISKARLCCTSKIVLPRYKSFVIIVCIYLSTGRCHITGDKHQIIVLIVVFIDVLGVRAATAGGPGAVVVRLQNCA